MTLDDHRHSTFRRMSEDGRACAGRGVRLPPSVGRRTGCVARGVRLPSNVGRRTDCWRSAVPDERGQITAMLVLFAICLLLAVTAVTDVSAAYLRRQAVTSLADGAALAASDGAAAAGVYGGADDDFVTISQPAAEAAVDSYLRDLGAYSHYPGLRVAVQVVGYTVTVYLAMPYQLPVPVPGVPGTTTIHADGSSVMPIY